MAQYNLFNSDDVRVGLLLFSNMERAWCNTTCLIPMMSGLVCYFFRIWNEHGAIQLV